MHKRFWEIDLLRTNAIAVMLAFHTLYLLSYFGIHYTNLQRGFPLWFAAGGGTFIFLAGVSLAISHSRAKKVSGFVLRGLKIFALGMAITLVTWLISRTTYVRFGILHFFGIAFMLGPLFLRFRSINLILGIALMATGFLLRGVSVDFPWLVWLGLRPHGLGMWDYIPLLPWFGLFLIGMFSGEILYPQGNRRFDIHQFSGPTISALTFPGRHPLVIYLLQWPAIIGALLVLYPSNVLPYFPL